MIIGINLLFMRQGKVGGSEVFIINLLKNLLEIDKENHYIVIISRNNKEIVKNEQKNLEYLKLDFDNNSQIRRIFFEQIVLPQKIKEKKMDVFIAPANTGLIKCSCRQLLIIHDLIYFVYPNYYSFQKRIYLQNLVKYSCLNASKIVAVSQNTKNDIIKYLNIDKDKIKIVYEGVDFEKFSNTKKIDSTIFIKNKYGIDRYLYSPTSLYPHKNNELLIKMFARLKHEKKIIQKLIITGIDPFNKIDSLKSLICKYEMDKDIFYLGRVPEKELLHIYHGADIVLYLSMYEGFGLPVLEAMASECPVLSSNSSSLPEVVGDAGVLIDPHNLEDVSNKVYSLLINQDLRKKYVTKGLERARNFSWTKTAKNLIQLYE